MVSFVKITTGWVRQNYEPNEDGMFVCIGQEFCAGDIIEFVDDFGEDITPPDRKHREYQPYDMIQPGISKEILTAIKAGQDKVKKIQAKAVPVEFRKDSAWLEAINDVINRTGLAIRDEIECI